MRLVLAASLAVTIASAATGLDKSELPILVKAGVAEEILVRLVEQSAPPIELGPDDVTALRKAGVSERVIIATLAAASRQEPAVPAGGGEAKAGASPQLEDRGGLEIGAVARRPEPPPPGPEPARGQGVLTVRNLLERDIVLAADEERERLDFAWKGDAEFAMVIPAGATLKLFLKKDTYRLRWIGQAAEFEAKIKDRRETAIAFSGDRAVSLVVCDHEGRTRASGVIVEDEAVVARDEALRRLEAENRRLRAQQPLSSAVLIEKVYVPGPPVVLRQPLFGFSSSWGHRWTPRRHHWPYSHYRRPACPPPSHRHPGQRR